MCQDPESPLRNLIRYRNILWELKAPYFYIQQKSLQPQP